ncbi:sugar ABC transporter permease [Clostridium estertheticum]|uniref:carbohydrate ABC transporter permease n=1 Tax=Clostridium estertheticum TaxID=238834 RepID=UPI0013E95765|nr:sugar ABC transporter permease [Clostridium estertheticum]MBN4049329.1 sugar ABC transporter permease [bacterium AH-315-N14]MBZ9689822.1 sugar ABC transporter permease [Clostridium estertheticum]
MRAPKIKNIKRELSYELFLLPVLIAYFVFFVIPVVSSFAYSFTDWNKFSQSVHFIGIKNYINLFGDQEILTGIKNSLIVAALLTFFQNIIGVPLAIILDRPLKSRNMLRAIFFSPAVLSTLIVGFLWSYLMSSADYAVLNRILNLVGIHAVNWLGDSEIALYSVIATQVWQWTGWVMIIYIANLQSIPQELYEAAKIDGASGWKTFTHITMPLLYPAASVCLVTGLVGNLKVFDIIFALTQGGPGGATDTILTVLIKRGTSEGSFGYASAFGMVFLILVLLITGIVMKFLKKWGDSLS